MEWVKTANNINCVVSQDKSERCKSVTAALNYHLKQIKSNRSAFSESDADIVKSHTIAAVAKDALPMQYRNKN